MKHMKKSMLITTVMMVVLLVVALSTATFAWYTSSNTVSTTPSTVNSAESSGANIAIGWEATTPVGRSSLEFVTDNYPYNPMVPGVDEGETFELTNATKFYTANMSFNELVNHSSATPYVGKQADTNATTFYIVNYSLKATDISFTANVTGENAARLRVAVFNATTGDCVYVNADYYRGEIIDLVDASFDLTKAQPVDWALNYAAYSTSDSVFEAVKPVAPAFALNSFYKNDGSLLTAQPADWAANYASYSTASSPFNAVQGVAPEWAASTYYSYTPVTPAHLEVKTESIKASTAATTLAASDGVTGKAQGFIVKAWFDGPTQVDAFGGKDAIFTLTATATVKS